MKVDNCGTFSTRQMSVRLLCLFWLPRASVGHGFGFTHAWESAPAVCRRRISLTDRTALHSHHFPPNYPHLMAKNFSRCSTHHTQTIERCLLRHFWGRPARTGYTTARTDFGTLQRVRNMVKSSDRKCYASWDRLINAFLNKLIFNNN